MKHILTITEQDIQPDAPVIDTSAFSARHAARGVVIDHKGAVYLLSVRLHDYHKLPGGGIDNGETPDLAMKRECLEEIGCTIEIIDELGIITEYRNFETLVQTSYCFVARQTGEQSAPSLEEGEIAEGFEQAKAENIAAAIKLLENDTPNNIEGKFIRKRDLAILDAAQKVLS